MRYIDKVIKGEDAFNKFWAKFRPNEHIFWSENIAHCGEITIESLLFRKDSDSLF